MEEASMSLEQLMTSLEEAVRKMEDFYQKKDHENFNKTKKMVLKLQTEIMNKVSK